MLAKKDMASDFSNNAEWPKFLAYSFETNKILFLAGKGHGLSGFEIPDFDACNPEWESLFEELGALWVPNLLRNNDFPGKEEFLKKTNLFVERLEVIQA